MFRLVLISPVFIPGFSYSTDIHLYTIHLNYGNYIHPYSPL
nr:MAG TPA: hypothetical protein [Herelleviridae sp.]